MIENNAALEEYHHKLMGFYMEHRKTTAGQEFGFVIYGSAIAKSE